MYLSFYGLKKQPFHITPDPEFLYLSPSHKEALAAIIYGIEEKKGFVTIIGAVGVGKTTILRSYLEKVEKKHTRIVYIFNSKLTFEELLRTIYQELGIAAGSDDASGMVNGLYDVLIEEYRQGNTVVLVVDEAQNMPLDTLESLRMISNLETSKDKLIQIVLVGQPEFEEQLNTDRLRQLKQRLAIRSTILPLTKDESLDYIKLRLSRAGADYHSVFTAAALKPIMKTANGVPRVLNVLCDNALITGFGHQKKPVTKSIAKEIIRDFAGTTRPVFSGRWLPATAVLLLIALLAAGAVVFVPSKDMLLGKLESFSSFSRVKQHRPVAEVRLSQPTEPATQQSAQSSSSEAVKASSPAPGAQGLIMKTVAKGDTLLKLTRQVYGNSDAKLIKVIQKNNPQITNPDTIHPGSTIQFPSLAGKSENRQSPRSQGSVQSAGPDDPRDPMTQETR
jgi:general secretion pathway protein A